MNRSGRIGSAAVAAGAVVVVVLGGVGAGAAHGQAAALDGSIFTGPSVFSIERDDTGADVLTYRIESGRELGCMVIVGSKAIIDQAEDTARGITNPYDWFTSLNNENPESPTAYGAAIRAGQFNFALPQLEAGHDGPVSMENGPQFEMGTDFALHGMSACFSQSYNDEIMGFDSYIEFERAEVAELPPVGEAATPVFGSGS